MEAGRPKADKSGKPSKIDFAGDEAGAGDELVSADVGSGCPNAEGPAKGGFTVDDPEIRDGLACADDGIGFSGDRVVGLDVGVTEEFTNDRAASCPGMLGVSVAWFVAPVAVADVDKLNLGWSIKRSNPSMQT